MTDQNLKDPGTPPWPTGGPGQPPGPIVYADRRFGRKTVKTDRRTLKLCRYLTDELPAPPESVDWSKGITNWGMMLNDQLGCCTIAGVGHAVQAWTANTGTEFTAPDDVVQTYYEKWDGYDPSNPASDQGGNLLDVATDWKNNSFNGHLIYAFTSVDVKNQIEVQQAINLFGGLYTGFEVPQSAMDQNAAGEVWDVVESDGGSVGGHCVYIVGYNATGPVCVTWGALQQMTWQFWLKYFDEGYAIIGADWLPTGSTAPSGFDFAQLQNDLALIH